MKAFTPAWYAFVNWCMQNDKAKFYTMTCVYGCVVNSMPQVAKDELLVASIEYKAYLAEMDKPRLAHSNTDWKLY